MSTENIPKNENGDKSPKEDKEKTVKLDKTKPSDIKEKIYTTRQVETSVALLESPETDVVLEALLFISKYADLNKNNLLALVKVQIFEKLLKNFHKNICILRISLRLLSVMLNCEDGVYEFDQDKYDDYIIDIANMYIEHKDAHVKEFCVEILAKIAVSCRITTLIFKVDLFNPIFEHTKNVKNANILYYTLLLFFELIDAPAAISALPDCAKFDLNLMISHLNHKEQNISDLSLKIIEKLTGYGLPFLQEGFKKYCIVEKMFKIIMDGGKSEKHPTAIKVVHNCLISEETCSYFIESVEFLELCQWVKTCPPKFLLPLIEVFIKLTSIPELKQILFDLSVEEAILYFFRFKDKEVINKTCEAVSNMTTHKYCCEEMLTPIIAKTLIEVLQRQNDEVDPYNEIALKTVFHFIRRYFRALAIFLDNNLKPVLLDYFHNKLKIISEDSVLMVLEILYRCMAHPGYQGEFISDDIFKDILIIFDTGSVKAATLCCEMMCNILPLNVFRKYLLQNKGIQIFLRILKATQDMNLLTQILYFIFSCLVYDDIAMQFIREGLLTALKSFNEYFLHKVPITKRVRYMALNYYPPIKFHETGKLEITDKMPNRFYVINGPWSGPFPFLEILEMMHVSPYSTIYLVDYSYEVVKDTGLMSQSSLVSSKSIISESTISSKSTKSLDEVSIPEIPSVFDINYGQISSDVFLPRYIYHLKKYEKFLEGPMEERIQLLAEYVDTLLCGPKENLTIPQKLHEYKLHIQCLKQKLGNNIIPIGFLRLGFHCERALLFKALADKICIPCSLVKGNLKIYWNEVAVFELIDGQEKIRLYVVDLMYDIGNLMLVGSREANKYCNLN